MLLTGHCHLEAHLQDALHLRTGVDVGIVGLIVILILGTEIHTASQLANHHKVGTLQEFFFQWRLVQQTVECSHRAHVGKQTQLLTHGQQTCLRTYLSGRIVVELQRANSSKQHSVGLHTYLVGAVGIRIAHLLDGMSTTDSWGIFKLVTELSGNRIHHSHTLFHNLWAYSIAL